MAAAECQLAPVVLFAYRRPEHTRRLLGSLLANPEARQTQVYVFLDGSRTVAEAADVAATGEVIRSVGLSRLTLVERPTNLGLAHSIIDGVTRVCTEHGRVIVLEDDLVLAPTFLDYMNRALDQYQDTEKVFCVSGFMYPLELNSATDAVFLPFFSSWGWATWQRAWSAFDAEATGYAALKADRSLQKRFDLDGNYPFFEMLEAWKRGRNDSWAIRWYLSGFMRGRLSLFPARSLVENRGFGQDATHCFGEMPPHARAIANSFRVRAFPPPVLDAEAFRRVKRFLGRETSLLGRVSAVARDVFQRFTR